MSIGDTLSRKLWRLESAGLCAAARRRTGLEHFGDPPLEPALSILVNSMEAEANLHPLGRFLMRIHLRDLLETRLRLTAAWSEQAEALQRSVIERPVFITGMPRSGSTFLHELLAEDPGNRAPRVWEVMFPVPRRGAANRDPDPRIRKAEVNLWWFRRLAPQADSVYPMRARTPHECVAIHSYTLLSEEFVSTCPVPTYEAFLRAADLTPAYAWEKRFLQYLQLGAPTRQWMLKSPDHVYGLKGLFAAFPDAVIIQTHRNPLEVLKSSVQVTELLHGMFARVGDQSQLGAREARVLAESMERFIRFRDEHPHLADRFIDVKYGDLIKDSVGVVRQIYERLNLPLTQIAAQRIQELASGRGRYRSRQASRTLADLGLDAAVEVRRFEPYCARFGIPCVQPG
jgi:hypothetical protein